VFGNYVRNYYRARAARRSGRRGVDGKRTTRVVYALLFPSSSFVARRSVRAQRIETITGRKPTRPFVRRQRPRIVRREGCDVVRLLLLLFTPPSSTRVEARLRLRRRGRGSSGASTRHTPFALTNFRSDRTKINRVAGTDRTKRLVREFVTLRCPYCQSGIRATNSRFTNAADRCKPAFGRKYERHVSDQRTSYTRKCRHFR